MITDNSQLTGLRSKNVLITGGASGIGADLVRAFCGSGAHVAIFDIQDESGELLTKEMQGLADYFHCDLTDVDSIKASVEQVRQKLGPVSILVNNAANDDRKAMADIDVDYWDWSQQINLRSQFFTAQAVVNHMRESGGAIVNLSSIAWRIGVTDITPYATAKAGILGLTRSLASELGAYNIRVNSIEPGAVITDKQRALWYPTDADVQRMVDRQMLPRILTGTDIATLALFLASDQSAAITGQSIQVDAGFQ